MDFKVCMELCVEHAIMIHKVTQWEGFFLLCVSICRCVSALCSKINIVCADNAGHSGGSFTQAVYMYVGYR